MAESSTMPAGGIAISTPGLSVAPNSSGSRRMASSVTPADSLVLVRTDSRAARSTVSLARRRRRTSRASLSRTAVPCADSFGDLVDFGDEQSAWPGNPELDRAVGGWIEGRDRHEFTIDESAFEALGAREPLGERLDGVEQPRFERGCRADQARQTFSFLPIHSRSSFPSEGSRPGPVRRSTASCDGATTRIPSRICERSNATGS